MRFPWRVPLICGFLPENRRDRLVILLELVSHRQPSQAATMRYLVAAVVTMAMLSGSAFAFDMQGESKDPLTLKYEREAREKADAEKAYNEQMKRLKAQAPTKAKVDPWSNVRPAGDTPAKRERNTDAATFGAREAGQKPWPRVAPLTHPC